MGGGAEMEVSGETPETGSEESPVSETPETSSRAETTDDDMASEDEEEGPVRLFTLHLVNSYGNAQIEPLSGEGEETIKLTIKNYLSLDWQPRAKQKFFNEKAAEDFTRDESWNGKITPKKQVE